MISGYFMDGARVVVFSANGTEINVLGRFRLDKEIGVEAIADEEIRAEAEKLRLKILAQTTQVQETDLAMLLQTMGRLTSAFEAGTVVDLTPEQRDFYRVSMLRAGHRLRKSMENPAV